MSRDVLCILVTSRLRIEDSPVKNFPSPWSIIQIIRFKHRLFLFLLLSLVDVREAAISSTSVFYPPAFQRPTYLCASRASTHCIARMYIYFSYPLLRFSARRSSLLFLPRFIDDNCCIACPAEKSRKKFPTSLSAREAKMSKCLYPVAFIERDLF